MNFSCRLLLIISYNAFILRIFVKKRNLKEGVFVLTIKASVLRYFNI